MNLVLIIAMTAGAHPSLNTNQITPCPAKYHFDPLIDFQLIVGDLNHYFPDHLLDFTNRSNKSHHLQMLLSRIHNLTDTKTPSVF